MTLLNITMTPLGWSILSLTIVQLFAFGKFIISLYNRLSLVESKLQANTIEDAKSSDYIRSKLGSLDGEFDAHVRDSEIYRERTRKETYKETKRIEDKCDSKDKESNKRINDIAQGLVIAETKLDAIKK